MLGISPEAVRARMHRGTLPKEKGDDGTVYVRLNDDRMRSNGDGADDQTPMVEILRDQVAYLREQLDREREARTEERRRQDTIIMQLTQANAALAARVPELEASPNGQEDAQEPPDASGGVEAGERSGEAQRWSWWHKLWGPR